ncbi:MAG TPA: zinc ABC transporter substrate-binding protein [Candidatus Limnocylindria bacterium]|nr:zinc ABC transporter substrate-binding protein [Candidatus Limnocylindria bacterium]
MSRPRLGLALASVLMIAGCEPAPPPAKPLVVATIYPLWEFSRQVAGDRAEVVSLVPAGVEPHDWEPVPRDVSQVQRAAVFVHTGTDLDAWAEKLLADLGGRRRVVVNTRDGLSVLTVAGVVDPHLWLDPSLARTQVLAIAAGLEQADPAGRATYAENARTFVAHLEGLDQEFAAGLAACARREIVTSHAAFAYLARRYRLTQIPVMGLSPEAEPSPADLAAIVRTARRLKVTHVFFETLVSPRLAETLGRELGATALPLNPIEGVSPAEAAAGAGYLTLMRANLVNLRTALGCR